MYLLIIPLLTLVLVKLDFKCSFFNSFIFRFLQYILWLNLIWPGQNQGGGLEYKDFYFY